ncbi:hypothetical protein [Flavobacterium sp.]|uniref:hypothetical protein n=1 Tax=Flavobacterium sp. TaxID=239 RepID=UPI004033D35F
MYNAHEIRSIIRQCITREELFQVELHLLMEGHLYSPLILYVFEEAMFKQRLKICGSYDKI